MVDFPKAAPLVSQRIYCDSMQNKILNIADFPKAAPLVPQYHGSTEHQGYKLYAHTNSNF